MSINESAEFMNHLQSIISAPESKAVLEFAKQRGLEKAEISTLACKQSAASYAVQLLYNLYAVSDMKEANGVTFERLALLTALEASKSDGWNFGSKLLYDLKRRGIAISREEVVALLAQEPSSSHLLEDTAPEQELQDEFVGNLPVDLFCANILTLFGSLPGQYKVSGQCASVADESTKMILPFLRHGDPASSLITLFNNVFAGDQKFAVFANYLQKSGFYFYPASDTGIYAVDGGLAKWCLNTFLWLIILQRPKDAVEVKKLLLAAVGQGLCHIGRYKKITYQGESLIEDGYNARIEPVPVEGYIISDKMPFGDGRKSLYILSSYFGNELPEDVAAAIDCYETDPQLNPQNRKKLMQNPLCLLLYVAGIQAAHHYHEPWVFRASGTEQSTQTQG